MSIKKIKNIDKQVIVLLYLSGFNGVLIAKEYNVVPEVIYKILRKENVMRYKESQVKKQDEENIVTLYQSGNSVPKIANLYNITPMSIYFMLRKNNIEIRNQSQAQRKYSLNEDYFENIDCEEKAYFLGWVFADGYINEKGNCMDLGLKIDDTEILNKLNNLIKSDRPLLYRKVNKFEQARLSISSKKIINDLKKYGLHQAKSFTIKFPILNGELYKHFIRGYFDGDGCIYIGKKSKSVSMRGNYQFLNGLNCIIPEDFKGKIYKSKSIDTLLFTSKKSSAKFLKWIYDNAIIYLNRKYLMFKKYLESGRYYDVNQGILQF